jgi:o-succinylbenzoate---CoA ligase
VLVRSLVARTSPVVLDGVSGGLAEAFVTAAGQLPGARRYTSLVPTQLLRLLEAGDAATDALTGFDAVLVGGAACPPRLRSRALAAGVRLVLTYGSTETCGGCVYDGVALPGVDVRIDDVRIESDVSAGPILVAGPVLARGYLGEPAITAEAFVTGNGTRWFRSSDVGRLDGSGNLTVVGRLDDVIVTGGVKISPAVVESALLQLPEVAEAVVVGVPDAEWGHRVAAAIVAARGSEATIALDRVRTHVATTAGPRAAPRQLLLLSELPLRGPGKPDRAAIVRLLAADQTPVG